MALAIGTNVGFVTTAPTTDPAGSTSLAVDGAAIVVNDTSPVNAVSITEIGFYRSGSTDTANFEVGLYAADGSGGIAGTRLFVDATNSSSVNDGWITVAVDWAIDPSTSYWIGVQMDAHTGSSNVDTDTSGGTGYDRKTSQTTLTDPFGGGALTDADGMAAIYALVETNDPPTVVLNTPADASSDSDTTPTFDFTGTDPEGDSVRYQIQINDADSFGPFGGLLDSYHESNQATEQRLNSGDITEAGQSITGDGSVLSSVKFYLKKEGSPTGNATAKVYAHTGTFGGGGTPTGAAIATSNTFNVATLTTSFQLIEFTFASPPTLTNGTNYCVVVTYSGGGSSDNVRYGMDDTSPTHAGNLVEKNGSDWFGWSSTDIIFYTYTTLPLIEKDSGVDSGFANPDNGGDTDPFNSGENIQFTVQAGDALGIDTYYWRVRGIDPSGSNTYGAWSSSRSFTITAGGGGETTKETWPILTGRGFWGPRF